MKKNVALMVIGNEVLNGSTLDTNSNFMCQFAQSHNSEVTRIVTIPDEHDIVSNELKYLINQCYDVIVTFGGLGPTKDDLTIEAVSSALNMKLKKNDIAASYINQRYKELGMQGVVETNPSENALIAREKMSVIPVGAEPLYNPVGAAPAIVIKYNKINIVCFPGVPKEISAICAKYDETIFKKIFGEGCMISYRIVTSSNDESELATPVKKVVIDFPNLYIKSRPVYGSYMKEIGITITGSGQSYNEIEKQIKLAISKLEKELGLSNISIKTKERII